MDSPLWTPGELRAYLGMARSTFDKYQAAGSFRDLTVPPRYRLGLKKYSQPLAKKRYPIADTERAS